MGCQRAKVLAQIKVSAKWLTAANSGVIPSVGTNKRTYTQPGSQTCVSSCLLKQTFCRVPSRLISILRILGMLINITQLICIIIPSACKTTSQSVCHKFLMYESFIPIRALAFYIAAYRPSSSKLDKISELVIMARKELEQNPGFLNILYSQNSDNIPARHYTLQNILEARRRLINEDKSFIFKRYIDEAFEEAQECPITQPNPLKPAHSATEDKEYMRMIERLAEGIYSNKNIMELLEREQDIFYRSKVQIPEGADLRIRRMINLGGCILMPSEMFQLIGRIYVKNKEEHVRKWVSSILKPIEELELHSRFVSIHEKRIALERYLEGCLHHKEHYLEEGFIARAEILRAAYENASDRERVTLSHELLLRRILQLVKMMDVEQKDNNWKVFRFNNDIEERYIKYLMNRTEESKEDLLKLLE